MLSPKTGVKPLSIWELDAKMQQEISPVRLEISLVENVLSLGEPIVLRYEFIGVQSEVVLLDMGRDRKEWLSITFVDAKGKAAPAIADPRMQQGGLRRTGVIGASATSHAVEYVVATRLLHPMHAGAYRLIALARLPYAMKSQSEGVWSHLWEQTYGTVLTRGDTFALTLTPLDPDRLQAVAQQLAGTAAQDNDRVRGTVALQALFSMPGKYVFPIWQEVTQSENPTLLRRWDVISDELARVQSLETANILSEMVWNPPLAARDKLNSILKTSDWDLMGLNNVAMKFNNMYFTADPDLKQHIAEMYLARGSTAPQTPIMIID